MTAIQITLNGQVRELGTRIQLDRLLDLFSLPKQRVAVELNGQVVRRTDWPDVCVGDGDKIEVVHFVGGG